MTRDDNDQPRLDLLELIRVQSRRATVLKLRSIFAARIELLRQRRPAFARTADLVMRDRLMMGR